MENTNPRHQCHYAGCAGGSPHPTPPPHLHGAKRGNDCMLLSSLPLRTKSAPIPWHLSEGDFINTKETM